MNEPRRAAVRPRVLPLQGTTPVLLGEEIRAFVEAGARGNVALTGPIGSGKTTALADLAARLPPEALAEHVTLLDEPSTGQLLDKPGRLVIYTAAACSPDVSHLAVYTLARWDRDDLIEYLLSEHRPRCAAVMARIGAGDHCLLEGSAELWQIVLDRLAAEETLPDVRRALHRHLQEHLTDIDLLERARSACLNVVVKPEVSLADAVTEIVRPGFFDSLIRLLRHPALRMLLASERIAADLHGEADCDYLSKRLTGELVDATGRLIARDDLAQAHLHKLLAGPSWSHAMTVSLLHAAHKSADLREQVPTHLAGAYLHGVSWPSASLVGADLTHADLCRANLREANLNGANASQANLRRACLSSACLDDFLAEEADLSGAVLDCARGHGAFFGMANLEQADFTSAALLRPRFNDSNLTSAIFRGASLVDGDFSGTTLTNADFSHAKLAGAVLSGVRLRDAHWEGADFWRAQLEGCDLEYHVLPEANFAQANLRTALLTGSVMVRANFHKACLREAGLADIEWEGADLRGADLRGASFHLGSTRSGLVGSTIPCEGSRTGFYTDEYEEQSYKAPEEIRKANLCGADLREAILDGVDFYLVDLRGAILDPRDEPHLRRCGAILETRV